MSIINPMMKMTKPIMIAIVDTKKLNDGGSVNFLTICPTNVCKMADDPNDMSKDPTAINIPGTDMFVSL